jgi:hypothetical protein
VSGEGALLDVDTPDALSLANGTASRESSRKQPVK